MMDRAINKNTGELISAFEVFKNGSYQNLTKGEWIAPNDSADNWNEVIEEDKFVHYVGEKRFTNYNEKDVVVRPHFAKYPGSSLKTNPESPEHKMLKDWLFYRLKEDDLDIIYSHATKKYKYTNSDKLSELDIDWNNFSVEVPIRGIKNLRADILLPFKSKHKLLGYGLCFEIQISNQNEEVKFDRTIDRAINGWSTIWLFKKDFNIKDNIIELKNNKLQVFSFSSQLKYSGKKFMKNLKINVEQQCRYLDEKIIETNIAQEKLDEKKEEVIKELLDRLNCRESILFNKIKSLEGNPFEQLVEKYKEDISEKGKEIIIKTKETINELEEMQEKFNPRIMPCKKCNQGYMIFKTSPIKKKELYECQACKNVIWVK